MNETDKKLYELFRIQDFIALGYWEGKELPKYLRLPEPQLHDVFRALEDKHILCEVIISRFTDKYILFFSNEQGDTIDSVSYNPTLPLLEQEESTKQAIINLFTNN